MATLDDSPSLFAGQSWSDWATVAPLSPLNEPSDEGTKEKEVDDTESMKLSSEDMCLFGHCPSQDEFYLVLCEKCRKVVKPQAFKRHLQERHGLTTIVPASSSHSSYPTSKLSSPTSKLSSPPSKLSSPTSKLSSPISKLSSPTKSGFKFGHSVPTKASVKEVPPAISNAQKIGASVSARLNKNSEKNKKNHSMPVVKVERMEVKKVSQHYEPISVTKSHSLPNGNVKDTTSVITPSITSAPISATSGVTSSQLVSSPAMLTPVSQSLTPFSVNNVTVAMATTTLTTTTTACVKTTMSVIASPPVAMTSWLSSSSSSSVMGTLGSVSNISSGVSSLSASTTNLSLSSVSSIGSTSSITNVHKKKPSAPKVDKPDKLIPCKDREYDCNKHCGVIVEETGKACTRSLTCKTHALSLRRKVPGRRKPFDDLLKEHRAAKELLIKQKAEQKAAQKAQAAASSAHVSGSQLAAHLLTAIPSQSKMTHPKPSLVQPRLSYPDQPKKLLKQPLKPNNILQQRTSTSSLYSPPDPGGGISTQDISGRLSDGEGDEEEVEKGDNCFIPYHPRPAAVCTFGARSHTMGSRKCFMFGRKTDFLRAAFLNVLDKHLNPPPPKKLCVESNLPKEPQFMSSSKDPYEFNIDGTRSNQFKPVLNSNNNNKPIVKAKSKLPNVNRAKVKDGISGSRSPGHSNSAMPQGSNCATANLKRKRSGSDTAASSPTTYTTAQAFNTVISSITSLNSHTNSALTAITIPNLSTANISNFNATLPTAKTQKNNIYKDLGLFVTGLDPSLMNGQYINIANAHPQQVDDKTVQQAHVITSNKNNNPKILNLETLTTLQKNNVITMPPLFMESTGTTVLAPVTIASSLNNNPVVTITTNPTVSPPQQSLSTATTFRSASVSPQVSSHISLSNGIIPTSSDKSTGNHRHNVLHPNKKGSIQGTHGLIGNTVIASPNNPSHVFTTQLAQLQVKPVAKQGATNKVTMPVSLTFPLNLGVAGQQPTLFITGNDDAQQQVSSSPSNHMS